MMLERVGRPSEKQLITASRYSFDGLLMGVCRA